MFLDCASEVLVAPPTTVTKLWLENHIFTFFDFSETNLLVYYPRFLLELEVNLLNMSNQIKYDILKSEASIE